MATQWATDENFYAQESLKQAMGDLTPTIEALLLALRGYTCVNQQ